MTHHVLVADDRYGGKYVALRSIHDNEVIASGDSPADVLAHAQTKGVEGAVLFFVPRPEMTIVY